MPRPGTWIVRSRSAPNIPDAAPNSNPFAVVTTAARRVCLDARARALDHDRLLAPPRLRLSTARQADPAGRSGRGDGTELAGHRRARTSFRRDPDPDPRGCRPGSPRARAASRTLVHHSNLTSRARADRPRRPAQSDAQAGGLDVRTARGIVGRPSRRRAPTGGAVRHPPSGGFRTWAPARASPRILATPRGPRECDLRIATAGTAADDRLSSPAPPAATRCRAHPGLERLRAGHHGRAMPLSSRRSPPWGPSLRMYGPDRLLRRPAADRRHLQRASQHLRRRPARSLDAGLRVVSPHPRGRRASVRAAVLRYVAPRDRRLLVPRVPPDRVLRAADSRPRQTRGHGGVGRVSGPSILGAAVLQTPRVRVAPTTSRPRVPAPLSTIIAPPGLAPSIAGRIASCEPLRSS